MKNYTASLKSTKFLTRKVLSSDPSESVTDRQERVQGFDQSIMERLRVTQVGAGGLGGEIAQGLVRKGAALIKVFDGDTVELSNLSRQFFYEEDLYKNKAISLARNLVKEGVRGSLIMPYPLMIQKAIEDRIDMGCDVVICAPDNDETRVFISRYFYDKAPVIFTGLDQNANTGYVFIQEPGKACIGCALPNAVGNRREPCPNTPAVIDLVKIISGFVLFSVDSTIMRRKRNWNYRQLFLGGFVPEILKSVDRKEGCSLCGGF
ncbi:MAG: ThiF family adenylyltransferase [Thermodesulfobacteriota bacterium]